MGGLFEGVGDLVEDALLRGVGNHPVATGEREEWSGVGDVGLPELCGEGGVEEVWVGSGIQATIGMIGE